MKHTILSAVILLPLAYSRTAKELCRGTAELSSDGNWYCSEVWAITYRNISQPGAYNRTTTVDPKTGLCGHERVDYPSAGPLTPLFGQVSMHLRGPMNVSQLAVYQLPGDARAMEKRNTVPFYNRRRSLTQPEIRVIANTTTRPTLSTSSSWTSLFNRDACTTSSSCAPTTVTHTVTVKAACSPTDITQSGPNTTYIGPPLPCLPTSRGLSISGSTPPEPNCTCIEDEDPEPIFQRPNGQVYVSPTPTLKHAPGTSSTQDTLPVSQHPDGQPFEVPPPSSSPPQDTLPVSQHPDGQLFDSPSPSPSSTQDILPVSQLPDGQPIQFPSPSPSSMQGILTVSQRPDGQPIVPSPSPSSPQETLPVSQRPDGQPFDIPLPSPSPPQDPVPVSQRPDGQPFDIPSPSPSPISKRQGSDWKRIAYYTSTSPAQATGLSFMANLGDPQKSGTFDYAFGNSLSYVTPRGDEVAAESQPFEGTLKTSENEIVVLSDKECDTDCPYWRPDATSHYGWSGSSKAFFIEFQMDHYDNVGTDQGLLSDAPAYWFLNAAIPRILQYGNDRNNVPCSCWSTGCGEFDAFELLSKGAERAKSTIHRQGNLEGGDSNYFSRPVGKKMKFAVVWHYPHITALVLDEDFDFTESMSNDAIQKLVAYDPDSWVHSLYAIGD